LHMQCSWSQMKNSITI